MPRYFDGMGNELTNYVNGLEEENQRLKLENLKLKHDLEVKSDVARKVTAHVAPTPTPAVEPTPTPDVTKPTPSRRPRTNDGQ